MTFLVLYIERFKHRDRAEGGEMEYYARIRTGAQALGWKQSGQYPLPNPNLSFSIPLLTSSTCRLKSRAGDERSRREGLRRAGRGPRQWDCNGLQLLSQLPSGWNNCFRWVAEPYRLGLRKQCDENLLRLPFIKAGATCTLSSSMPSCKGTPAPWTLLRLG